MPPWKFPKQRSGDGIMGKNCISAAHEVTVTGATDNVALHVNFMIGAGSFNKGATTDDYPTLTFHLTLLHITARSAKNQISIVEDGPSILTAAKSIHCGPGNDWNWAKPNVGELTTEIGALLANLQAAVTPYGMAYMAGLVQRLKDEIIRAGRSREVVVQFTSDSTWT